MLRILILEDSAANTLLLRRELEAAGLPCDTLQVQTPEAFRQALSGYAPDLILAEFLGNPLPGAAGIGHGLDGREGL